MNKIYEKFNDICYERDSRLVKLEYLIKSNRRKVIYGAGRAALLRYNWFQEYAIGIDGFCVDNEYYIENQQINGFEVKKIDEIILDSKVRKIDLIIGFEDCKKARDVYEQLNNESINVVWFEDPFRFRDLNYDFFLRHYNEYKEAYELLEDQESKAIFLAAIRARITGESDCIVKYKSKSKWNYDFDLLQIKPNETLVDCGAYDGDTIKEFLNYTKGKCNKIFAFEPDSGNAKKIAESYDNINIQVISKCTGDKDDFVKFYADNSLFSNVAESGVWGGHARRDLYGDTERFVEVPMCKIDNELGEEEVSLIKMDIEGSELVALIGARETIERCFPKLAICIYHKAEDFYTLIHEIHKHDSEQRYYKYYLRHHSDDMCETVLYALPVCK